MWLTILEGLEVELVVFHACATQLPVDVLVLRAGRLISFAQRVDAAEVVGVCCDASELVDTQEHTLRRGQQLERGEEAVAIAVHGQADVAKTALDFGPPVTKNRRGSRACSEHDGAEVLCRKAPVCRITRRVRAERCHVPLYSRVGAGVVERFHSGGRDPTCGCGHVEPLSQVCAGLVHLEHHHLRSIHIHGVGIGVLHHSRSRCT